MNQLIIKKVSPRESNEERPKILQTEKHECSLTRSLLPVQVLCKLIVLFAEIALTIHTLAALHELIDAKDFHAAASQTSFLCTLDDLQKSHMRSLKNC